MPNPAAAHSLPNLHLANSNTEGVKTCKSHTQLTAELRQVVAQAKQFVMHHAAPGAARDRAVGGLDSFLNTKVNCKASKLHPLTLGANKQGLEHFVAQLHNPKLPLETRTAAALDLFGDLGTCAEGEGMRIQAQNQHLAQYGLSLGQRYHTTKENLLDQTLQTLMRTHHAHTYNYNKLEIHHIQALKNRFADEWGVAFKPEPYTHNAILDESADMARELVALTATPQAVAGLLAQQLHNMCHSHLGGTNWGDGACTVPYQQSQVDSLHAALQLEYGNAVNLHDLLTPNDDYTELTLPSTQQLEAWVLGQLQAEGVVAAAPADQVTLSVKDAMQTLSTRGPTTQARPQAHWGLGAAPGSATWGEPRGVLWTPQPVLSALEHQEKNKDEDKDSDKRNDAESPPPVTVGLMNRLGPAPESSRPESKNLAESAPLQSGRLPQSASRG